MAILTHERISEALKQAYDPARVRMLYRKSCYAFGQKWDEGSAGTWDDGSIVECPDVTVTYLQIGQSRRIMNTAFISLTGAMYAQPAPEFPQLGRYEAEVRKRFLLARGEDMEDSEWADEDAMAFLDGDGLGFGGSQICLRTNPATGLQRVSIEHVPAFHVVHDRIGRGFGRSRMVAFVKYMAPDVFAERFGEKKRAEYERGLYSPFSEGKGEQLRVCRVIEYYDLGLWGQEPTRAILAGDLDGEILEDGPNVFGTLPFAHFSHWTPPGCRYPIGRVDMQMGSQEALNEVEDSIRRATKRVGVTGIDVNLLVDENDAQAVIDGEADWVKIDSSKGNGLPFVNLQGADVSATVMNWRAALLEQFTTDSGQTDLDRGNQLAQKRTLGEAELLQSSSQGQGSWSMLQATKYHRRKYEKALAVAREFDRDPVDIDVFGVPVTLNDEGEPMSSVEQWLKKPSRVVVSEDTLRYQDVQAKRSERLQQLQAFLQLSGPLANPQYLAEEAAKATDLDPKDAIVQAAPGLLPGMDPAMAAQMMQGPGANGGAAPGLTGPSQV